MHACIRAHSNAHARTHIHARTLITFLFPSSQIKFLKVEMEKKTKIIKDLQQEVSPPRSACALPPNTPLTCTSRGFFCHFYHGSTWCLHASSCLTVEHHGKMGSLKLSLYFWMLKASTQTVEASDVLPGTAHILSITYSRWPKRMWEIVRYGFGIVSRRLHRKSLYQDATKAQKKSDTGPI